MKISSTFTEITSLTRATITKWNDDSAMRLAAALSYYTVFSLGPLLLLATAIAGFFFGEEAARGELSRQIDGMMGPLGARAVESLLAQNSEGSQNLIASIVGLAVLLLGATGVFIELKAALNTVWGVVPQTSSGVLGFLRERLLSFAMVLAIGFLLLVSLVVSAVLSAVGTYFASQVSFSPVVMQALNLGISFAMVTILFALIFKVLPETDVAWGDVWLGAAITAFLFSIGKFLIGLYLGKSSVASAFGASASIVVILVWTYYSSLILFFGAEFTYVYSHRGEILNSSDKPVFRRPNASRDGKSKPADLDGR